MMQRITQVLENNDYVVHAVYTLSDARTNLRVHKFSLVVIGGLEMQYWDEIKLFIIDNQPDCRIIEGRPSNDEIQNLD